MTASVVDARAHNSTNGRTKRTAPVSLRAARGAMRVLSRVSPYAAAAVAERMFLTPRRHERPAAERALLERADRVRLSTDDGDLAGWSWGTGDRRVLLVHGWEGRGAQLGELVLPLVARGFRVLTFDAPAHGDSPGSQSSLFHFAHAVERAVADLGPFEAIVTHSMGGASTLWAYRHGPLAGRLVMIAPPVDLRDFTRALSDALALPEAVRDRVHDRLACRFGVPVEAVRAELLAKTMSGPLLVVHDANDREVPVACGESVARAWPGATLLRTEGLGHVRILRDAATLDAIVRFVASTPGEMSDDSRAPRVAG